MIYVYADIAQWVEQRTRNAKVMGSNPIIGILKHLEVKYFVLMYALIIIFSLLWLFNWN